MSTQHKNLAAGEWENLTTLEQFGNIGSEVSRALNWRKKGNIKLSRNALDRALELIGLSLRSTDSLPRLNELTRLRETLLDDFYGDNQHVSTEFLWRRYFDHFAYASRKDQK